MWMCVCVCVCEKLVDKSMRRKMSSPKRLWNSHLLRHESSGVLHSYFFLNIGPVEGSIDIRLLFGCRHPFLYHFFWRFCFLRKSTRYASERVHIVHEITLIRFLRVLTSSFFSFFFLIRYR